MSSLSDFGLVGCPLCGSYHGHPHSTACKHYVKPDGDPTRPDVPTPADVMERLRRLEEAARAALWVHDACCWNSRAEFTALWDAMDRLRGVLEEVM